MAAACTQRSRLCTAGRHTQLASVPRTGQHETDVFRTHPLCHNLCRPQAGQHGTGPLVDALPVCLARRGVPVIGAEGAAQHNRLCTWKRQGSEAGRPLSRAATADTGQGREQQQGQDNAQCTNPTAVQPQPLPTRVGDDVCALLPGRVLAVGVVPHLCQVGSGRRVWTRVGLRVRWGTKP